MDTEEVMEDISEQLAAKIDHELADNEALEDLEAERGGSKNIREKEHMIEMNAKREHEIELEKDRRSLERMVG